MMHRATLIVGSTTAWHQQRFEQALVNGTGIQILTVSQMAESLAGGFLRAANRDEIQVACARALDSERSNLRHLTSLVDLPGMAIAVSNTLANAWASRIDLSGYRSIPRCLDLLTLEDAIVGHLPPNALTPPDLLAAALSHIDLATRLFGFIRVQGVYAMAPRWQPLLAALAERIPVSWETIGDADAWLAGTGIEAIRLAPKAPVRNAVSCANPTHEMVEALRWARELIVTGRGEPQDIGIAAASLEGFDDYVRAMCDESQLPLHFADGRTALSDFSGQQAASLAELLLHGISQDRVLRAVRLIRREHKELTNLPDGWDRMLQPDAPLLRLEHWRSEIDRINSEHGVDLRTSLLAFVEDMVQGSGAASAVGERWLRGRARSIWQKALAEGPPAAIATMLNRVRVTDERDPAASVIWGTAAVISTIRRKFIRIIGLTSRSWPRALQDDPLLPEQILGVRLAAYSIPELDRLHFDVLTGQATEVVFSRSRRDKEGRLLGISPIFPRGLEESALRQSRIPQHAFSQADRLLARVDEFGRSALASSVSQCLHNRWSADITPHDGLVRPDHPVIVAALNRVQSATSLRTLLRDPLAFVWKYALWWKQPGDTAGEEPLLYDDLEKGLFTHEVLEQAVADLEQHAGFSNSSPEQVTAAIAAGCQAAATRWELQVPVPPRAVWERMQRESETLAFKALTYPRDVRDDMHSFVEVPFGVPSADVPIANLPWDPALLIELPNSCVRLRGRIDRLDLSGDHRFARVIDYKTVGKTPKEDPYLNGGKELQRAIYACVVRVLLPQVQELEAELLYPETDSLYRAQNTDQLVADLVTYVNAARQLLIQGCALPGIGAEDDYNEMRFALPSNAAAFYLPQKLRSRNERMQALLPLWGA